jgi:predicted nucleic acid-binding protein
VILVDSNVWIDVIQRDSNWMDWSLNQLALAAEHHKLIINPVICAELATNFDTTKQLAAFVKTVKLKVQPISLDCAYLAGRAHVQYKDNKRKNAQHTDIAKNLFQVGVLADFFIGAHAQTEGIAILTRDAARYRTYFPSVELICP